MNRTEKKDYVGELNTALKASEVVVVAHYKGLTVADMTALRAKSRAAGVKIKVTQNRLTKLSLKETNFEGLTPLFKGPTVVAYGTDPVAPAKVLVEFAKTNEKLIVLGGGFGEKVMDLKQVQELAKIPSLNELRGKLVGLLQAPASQLARVFSAYSKLES